eukprot:gene3530-5032_t
MVNLESLDLSFNPLGIPPDITQIPRLTSLILRGTGINQWPAGAAEHDQLLNLDVRDNQITSIPEAAFTHPRARQRNHYTDLVGNPLSAPTRQRIAQFNTQSGASMQGALADATAVPPAITPWLDTLNPVQQGAATDLWAALHDHQGARPDDVFSVLADLTQ